MFCPCSVSDRCRECGRRSEPSSKSDAEALGIDLSPCEQRLCYENYVAVDSVAPAELGGPGDQEAPRRLCGRSTRPREWWLPQLQVAVIPY